jgi:hypothetical protein
MNRAEYDQILDYLHTAGRSKHSYQEIKARFEAEPAADDGANMAACVIVRKALDHGGQRHDPGRRDHPHLAHPAAEQLSRAVRLGDKVLVPAHQRADRRAQAFGQAERYGVGRPGQVRRRNVLRNGRVENSRAVDVEPQPVLLRQRRDGPGVVRRERHPAAVVMRVLDAHQAGDRVVLIGRANGGSDRLQGQGAVGVFCDRRDLGAGQGRQPALLAAIHVRPPAEDHFIAAPQVNQGGDGVGHAAAGHEQRRSFAHHRRSQ